MEVLMRDKNVLNILSACTNMSLTPLYSGHVTSSLIIKKLFYIFLENIFTATEIVLTTSYKKLDH